MKRQEKNFVVEHGGYEFTSCSAMRLLWEHTGTAIAIAA